MGQYYNYHGMIKRRIEYGELLGYRYTTKKGVGDCMVLVFSTHPIERVVRPHMYDKYLKIIDSLGIEEMF